MTKVICHVENCEYWKDSQCTANEITVVVTDGNKAGNVLETACQTFEPVEEE